MFKTLSYLWALFYANMKSYGPDKKKIFIMSFFMIIQNSMFFAIWVILFGSVKELRGWGAEDVARMFGLTASAIGLSLFCFNGARTIAYRIHEGTMDAFIARPREVLPALLMSSSSPASLGDLFYGPLMWLCFGNMGLHQWLLMIFLVINTAIIFTACTIAVFSAAFWLKGSTKFPEQLFEMLIIMSVNIVHGQPFLVKIIVYTVLPAAFINYLPVQLVREFDWGTFALVCGASVFYIWLAMRIFRAGLRRYVNSIG